MNNHGMIFGMILSLTNIWGIISNDNCVKLGKIIYQNYYTHISLSGRSNEIIYNIDNNIIYSSMNKILHLNILIYNIDILKTRIIYLFLNMFHTY